MVAEQTSIHSKLLAIQQALKAPKDLRNDFANFMYRSAESILSEVKPLLYQNNVTLCFSDELVNIGDRYYVKAQVTLSNGDQNIQVTALAREQEDKKGMDQAQITGAASSYARKYALCGLFAIDDSSDDPDTKDNTKEEVPPSVKQKVYLRTIAVEQGMSLDELAQDKLGRPMVTQDDAKELFAKLKSEGIIHE